MKKHEVVAPLSAVVHFDKSTGSISGAIINTATPVDLGLQAGQFLASSWGSGVWSSFRFLQQGLQGGAGIIKILTLAEDIRQ